MLYGARTAKELSCTEKRCKAALEARHFVGNLDSQLKIDFTHIQFEEFIQCPSRNCVVYVLWLNPFPDPFVEGFIGEEPGKHREELPCKSRTADDHGDSRSLSE